MLKVDLVTLRPWLQHQLEPISDADPSVLSDYILALLKHDLPLEALKQLCQDQLDDFLGKETAPFITRLFFFLTSNPVVPLVHSSSSGSASTHSLKRPLDASAHASPAKLARPKGSQTSGPYPVPTGPAAMRGDGRLGAPQPPHPSPFAPSPAWQTGPMDGTGTVNGTRQQLCKDYHFRGFCARGATCPFQHDDVSQHLSNAHPTSHSPVLGRSGPSGPPRPVNDAGAFMAPFGQVQGGNARQVPRRVGVDARTPTSTIAVENIPAEALSTLAVRTFFAQFGSITNIALDQARQRALVSYSTADQAQRALSSPAAIFSNRFVRVYRAQPPPMTSSTPLPTQAPPPNSASQHSPFVAAGVIPPLGSRPPSSTQALAPPPPPEDSVRADRLLANAAEQKTLMEQLDTIPPPVSERRRAIMAALRKLASEATTLSNKPQALAAPASLDPLEQLEKLRKEAAALGIDTTSRSTRGSTRGRGGGSFAARSSHSSQPRSFRLDNRTTKIIVRKLPEGASLAALRTYFEQFGDIVRMESSTAGEDAQLLEFRTRAAAEQALNRGTSLDGVGQVELQWAPDVVVPLPNPQSPPHEVAVRDPSPSPTEPVDVEGTDDIAEPSPPLAVLLRGDDDEAERSWNR